MNVMTGGRRPQIFSPSGGKPKAAITRMTSQGNSDNCLNIAGNLFANDISFWSFSQNSVVNAGLLESNTGNGLLLYQDASSNQFCSIALPVSHVNNSMYLVWPKNSGGYGKPFCVNRTTARWIQGSDTATTSTLVVTTYNAGTSYNANDRVIFSGLTYESIKAPNSGNRPDLSPTFWRRINYVYAPWNSTYIYNQYMRVSIAGQNYESLRRYSNVLTTTVTSDGASPNSHLTMANTSGIIATDFVNGAGIPLDAQVTSVSGDTITVTVNTVIAPATYTNVTFAAGNISLPPNTNPTWWRLIADGNRDIVSVYGINLTHQGDTQAQLHAGIWAVPPGLNPVGQWITPTSVSPYRVDFQMPVDSAQGVWNIYSHNGHGGIYGYSGPLSLNVTTAVNLGINYDNSTVDMAASGGDDSATFESKCATIQLTGQPGTLTLHTSVYHVSRTTMLAINGAKVRLLGTGKRGSGSETEIRILSGSSVSTMFNGNPGTAFQNLTLNATGDTASTASNGTAAVYDSPNGITSIINCTLDASPPDASHLIEALIANLDGNNTIFRLCDFLGTGINIGGGFGIIVDSNHFTMCGSGGGGFAAKDAVIDALFTSQISCSDNVVQDRVLAGSGPDIGHARFFGVHTSRWSVRFVYLGCNRTIGLMPNITAGAAGEGEQIIGESLGSMGMVPVAAASNSPPSVSIPRVAMFTQHDGTDASTNNGTNANPTITILSRVFNATRDVGNLIYFQPNCPSGWIASGGNGPTAYFIATVIDAHNITVTGAVGTPGNDILSGGIWFTNTEFHFVYGSDLSSSNATAANPTVTSASPIAEPNGAPQIGNKIWIPDNGSGPDHFISNGPGGRVYTITGVNSATSVVLDRPCGDNSGGGGGNCNGGAWSLFGDWASSSLRPTIVAGVGKCQENVCNGLTADSTNLTLLLEQPWNVVPTTNSVVLLWWSTSDMVAAYNVLSGSGSNIYLENGTPTMCSIPSGMTNMVFDTNVVSGLFESGREWTQVAGTGVDSNVVNFGERGLCPQLWNLFQNNVFANRHGFTVLGSGSLPYALPVQVLLKSHGGILRNNTFTLISAGHQFSQDTGNNNYLLEHNQSANAPYGVHLSDGPSQATDSSYQFYKNIISAGSASPNLEGIKFDPLQTYLTSPPPPTVFSQFRGYTNNDGTS